MPSLTRSERTRQALVHAAMKRFVADGVHQTSVADIAADVGVTERTFYRHFPSKHAVIFADYDIGFEWFARALARRPHGEPITASVRKAVDAFPFDFTMVQEAAGPEDVLPHRPDAENLPTARSAPSRAS